MFSQIWLLVSKGWRYFFIICMVIGVIGGVILYSERSSPGGFDENNGLQMYASPGEVHEFNISTGIKALGSDWESDNLTLTFDTPHGPWTLNLPKKTVVNWGPYELNSSSSGSVNVEGSFETPNDYQTLPVVLKGTLTGNITYAESEANAQWDYGNASLNIPVELNILRPEELKKMALNPWILLKYIGEGLGGGFLIAMLLFIFNLAGIGDTQNRR